MRFMRTTYRTLNLKRTWVENLVTATYILPWKPLSSIGGIMKFSIDYYERVNNYWHREIEADTLVEAQTIMREEIQGTEPDHIDIIGYEFEEGE